MKTTISLLVCVGLIASGFSQTYPSQPPPKGVAPTISASPPKSGLAGGIALLIVASIAGGFCIYAFWDPGPRWQTLVLYERCRLNGIEKPIMTNTVYRSGKAWPYAFTVMATNEFCSYRVMSIKSGD